MSTRTRIGRAALFSAAASAGLAAAYTLLQRSLAHSRPQIHGSRQLSALQRPVEILRDRWGVPHIYAETAHDLFFAQGYVHAQDRLFQMDLFRHVGTGRLSEVVGRRGITSDRMARTLGWPSVAEATVTALQANPEALSWTEAYAAGVNAFMQQGNLPPGFRVLAHKPELWSSYASAAFGTTLAWGLASNLETELVRAILLATLGLEKTLDLIPDYPADYPTVLPANMIDGRVAAELRETFQRAARDLPLGAFAAGSNNWVVSGTRTASGRPILANDPHLPPLFPPIWYENHLQGDGFAVTGFSLPGVPGVVIGHNADIAWGVTNAFPDVQDLYVEEFHPDDPYLYRAGSEWLPVEVIHETIHVRGQRPIVEEVRYTRHGPIVSALLPGTSAPLALQWSAHRPHNQFQTVFALNRATDWSSFQEAVREWAFPPQNFVFADRAGNIGYLMPGQVPVRGKGAGLAPVPGPDPAYDWQGWIPFEELPRQYNPPAGMIVTANNRVVDDSYPYLLTGEWLPPYRAQRIRSCLEQAGKLTIRTCADIQQDAVSLYAKRFLTVALPRLQKSHQHEHPVADQGLALLHQWHAPTGDTGHQMHRDRVAPTIFHAWLSCFTQAAMQQVLGPDLSRKLLRPPEEPWLPASLFFDIALELVVKWLEEEPPAWAGAIDGLLYPTYLRALRVLTATLGPNPSAWQWGRIHRLEFRHLLSELPLLGRLWPSASLPVGGDAYTINQSQVPPTMPPGPVQVIASCRMVIDVGEWDRSISALPGGQSGHSASEHYQDGLRDWLAGEYHPMLFSRARVEAEAAARLHILPLTPEGM